MLYEKENELGIHYSIHTSHFRTGVITYTLRGEFTHSERNRTKQNPALVDYTTDTHKPTLAFCFEYIHVDFYFLTEYRKQTS